MPKVTFKTPLEGFDDLVVEVDEDTSILEAAEEVGALVGSSCGGQCACSTCHVYIVEGEDSLTEMQDNEDDRMDMAFDVRPESRLGCQARLVGTEDIVVQISDESIKAWYDEHPNERKASGYQGGR
jgi:2Fe-2S ferredoxin